MKLSLVAAAGVVVALGLASTDARADDDGIEPAVPTVLAGPRLRDADHMETERRWYGWQTLMVDGLCLLTTPVGVGAPGLVLGAPIVHASHGKWGSAGASLGIRAGGAAAVFAWAASGNSRGDFVAYAVIIKAVLGGVIVHSIAATLDAAVFAYEDRPVRPSSEAKSLTLSPTAGTNATGGVSLGLAGTF